jgi:hypothetical protein
MDECEWNTHVDEDGDPTPFGPDQVQGCSVLSLCKVSLLMGLLPFSSVSNQMCALVRSTLSSKFANLFLMFCVHMVSVFGCVEAGVLSAIIVLFDYEWELPTTEWCVC